MLAMDPRWLGLDLRLLSAVELGSWHGNGGPTVILASGGADLSLSLDCL
jgi:hypothetical protein